MTKNISELIDLDKQFYIQTHHDLQGFSEKDAEGQYFEYDYWEGRQCNRYCLRENFVTLFEEEKILEIGPFVKPLISGNRVKYLDMLSTEELVFRAREIGFDPSKVPQIDYISRDGSLSCVNEKFDVFLSSHNFEHQPDLVTHLNEASASSR